MNKYDLMRDRVKDSIVDCIKLQMMLTNRVKADDISDRVFDGCLRLAASNAFNIIVREPKELSLAYIMMYVRDNVFYDILDNFKNLMNNSIEPLDYEDKLKEINKICARYAGVVIPDNIMRKEHFNDLAIVVNAMEDFIYSGHINSQPIYALV